MFKLKFAKDEDGYALLSVLMIGFLILSVLLGLFLVRYFNSILSEKRIQRKKLELACFSAIEKHLAHDNTGFNEDTYRSSIDSVKVEVHFRLNGLLYEVSAKAKAKRDSVMLKRVFASKVNPVFENALIISCPELNAAYAGSTKIKGDILAASSRITKGSIFGLKNSTDNYLDGSLNVSSGIKAKYFPEKIISDLFSYNLPKDTKMIKGNLSLSFSSLDTAGSLFIMGSLRLYGQGAKNSKKGCTKIFVTGETVIEEGAANERDLEIVTDSTVIIRNNAKLNNILVVSKKGIRINDNCTLKRAQLIARKFIRASRVTFGYPSVLCIYPPAKDTSMKNILELKSSILNGTAMLVSDFIGIWGNKSRISVDEKSVVQGVIYSENNSEILGKVKGAVYTNKLWYYLSPTEYINWLVDLDIRRDELDKNFLLPAGLDENRKLKVLYEEWIY